LNATFVRTNKRQRIINTFLDVPIGTKLSSKRLHDIFGSSFRSRVSEINRDSSSKITIRNKVGTRNNTETSSYWAELR
jgi:hypothetical protein